MSGQSERLEFPTSQGAAVAARLDLTASTAIRGDLDVGLQA